MATNARSGRPSSFSRAAASPSSSSGSSAGASTTSGVKLGSGGAAYISSGIPDLDKILGGGFLLGTLVMVMEDTDSPHHLALLQTFMSQGIIHGQELLFAAPSSNPRAFLGTLPRPVAPSSSSSSSKDEKDQEALRIAFQYKKYDLERQGTAAIKRDFSNDFDVRKPLERQLLVSSCIDCISIQDSTALAVLHDRCSAFLRKFPRSDGSIKNVGRIAIQSLCDPQCGYMEKDWDMVSFIRSLRAMVRSSNAVAVVTFPASLLQPSFSKRWQHLAHTLLSTEAIPDEDKNMAKFLTGYQDMLGFLRVHKVAQINSQVPIIIETTKYSLKLEKRKFLVLEKLNQAPVDGASGSSYGTTGSCSSAKGSPLDF